MTTDGHNEELKPCPFCGSENSKAIEVGKAGNHVVRCQNLNCSASGPYRSKSANAKKAWSTRAECGLVKKTPSVPIDYLKVLEDECRDLRCVAEPTGGDDADIAWHVVGHWMSQPQERVIGYGRTPKEAIEDAMRPRDYEGSLLDDSDTAARVIAPWPTRQHRPSFQSRVKPWMGACFGPRISGDRVERNHRFLEEALELVQACGCTREDCLQLVDYVYGRPVGEPSQEVGGVMVTLAALCLANELDMHEAAEVELARVWTKIDVIRAKQAAKPRGSALPVSPSYQSGPAPAQESAESDVVKELQERLSATERGERAADNEVERLQATVTVLVAALGPFAKAYQAWGGGNAREHFASSVVPAHFARAAEVVAKAKPAA